MSLAEDNGFERALARLPQERQHLLPALLLAQAAFGWVPDRAVERIAVHLRLTPSAVAGVATAYPDLRRRPPGRCVVRVCIGAPCWLAGAGNLLAALEGALGIRAGETTPDRGVTIEEAPCCFLCGVAPVVELDGVCHGRLSAPEAVALIAESRDKETGDGG